jgi:thiol-disulfide isomerase/thioredoxin
MKLPLPRLLLALCSLTVATAAEPTLKIGDPAPKLQTGPWIQGEPVKDFEKGKAYIVEFWATWCGPCRVTIPHLNELAEKFKDKGLIVIGQDVWEEDEDAVAPFVKKMGNKMTYRVALDDKSDGSKGKMATTWMKAADQSGIPSAFIVDTTGHIVWIDHPMKLNEETITRVLNGTFDAKAAAAAAAAERQLEAQLQEAWQTVAKAMKAKEWDTATEKLTAFAKLLPEEQKPGLDAVRLDISLGKKDYPGAYDLIRKISDARKDNPMVQNELAWRILTDPQFEKRDLELAETLATQASTAAEGKDPSILDTLARAKFMRGDKAEAVKLQEKAVSLADEDAKEMLQATLDSYRKGELPKDE